MADHAHSFGCCRSLSSHAGSSKPSARSRRAGILTPVTTEENDVVADLIRITACSCEPVRGGAQISQKGRSRNTCAFRTYITFRLSEACAPNGLGRFAHHAHLFIGRAAPRTVARLPPGTNRSAPNYESLRARHFRQYALRQIPPFWAWSGDVRSGSLFKPITRASQKPRRARESNAFEPMQAFAARSVDRLFRSRQRRCAAQGRGPGRRRKSEMLGTYRG